jgi:hypothetical protein
MENSQRSRSAQFAAVLEGLELPKRIPKVKSVIDLPEEGLSPIVSVPSQYISIHRNVLQQYYVALFWDAIWSKMRRNTSKVAFPVHCDIGIPPELFRKLFCPQVTSDGFKLLLKTADDINNFFGMYQKHFGDSVAELQPPVEFHFIDKPKARVSKLRASFWYSVYVNGDVHPHGKVTTQNGEANVQNLAPILAESSEGSTAIELQPPERLPIFGPPPFQLIQKYLVSTCVINFSPFLFSDSGFTGTKTRRSSFFLLVKDSKLSINGLQF